MSSYDKRKFNNPVILNFRIPKISEEYSPLKIVHSYLQEKKNQDKIELKAIPKVKSSWNQFSFSKLSIKPNREFSVLSEDFPRTHSSIVPIRHNSLRKLKNLRILKKIKPEQHNSEVILKKIKNINAQSLSFCTGAQSSITSKNLPNINRKSYSPSQLPQKSSSRLNRSPIFNSKINQIYKKILNIKYRNTKLY